MFSTLKSMFFVAAATAVLSMAQPAMAQRAGMSIGVGPNVRSSVPARTPTYSIPAYSDGNYIIAGNGTPTPTPFSGGFVPPPVISRPPLNAPNYYMPGDLYARSTYYVPANVQPILTYPAPLNSRMFPQSGHGTQSRNQAGPLGHR